MSQLKKNILIIEDNAADIFIYEEFLEEHYTIYSTDKLEEAFSLLGEYPIDCILLDYNLPGFAGVEFIEELEQRKGKVTHPIVLSTGGGSEEMVLSIMKAGAINYIVKDGLTAEFLKNVVESSIREFQLKEETQKARFNLEMKNEFVATMAHEIRSPLNGIVGLLDYLKDHLKNPNELEKHFGTLISSADDLAQLVNNVLDSSKIELGKIEAEYKQLDIEQYMFDLIAPFQNRAELKGLSFSKDIHLEKLMMDRNLLGQIIRNLIDNAVKYTQEGSVEVRSFIENEHDLIFIISDTGVGIPVAEQELIFKKFVRSADMEMKEVEGDVTGTGLGLFVVAKMTEVLNGTIKYENKLGGGSVFRLSIPVELVSKLSETEIDHESELNQIWNGKKVLVVDDKQVNRTVLKLMVTSLGMQVDIAEHGEEAIFMHVKNTYDVILMDLQMPVMNGETATHIIREKYNHPNLRIIPVTAKVKEFVGDIERLGFDGYIQKPVKSVDLIQVLNEIVG